MNEAITIFVTIFVLLVFINLLYDVWRNGI
jgi:hypothetical protein